MKLPIILLLATFSIQPISAQSNKSTDEALIRAARKASNEAFAKHNIDGIAIHLLDDFIGTWGNGGSNIGKDSAIERLKRSLDQIPGLTYVRTPKKIIISDADTLAFVTGKWIALKKKTKSLNGLEVITPPCGGKGMGFGNYAPSFLLL